MAKKLIGGLILLITLGSGLSVALGSTSTVPVDQLTLVSENTPSTAPAPDNQAYYSYYSYYRNYYRGAYRGYYGYYSYYRPYYRGYYRR